MFKTGLVIGAAVGYVLGTRDGRERYEQIAQAVRGLSSNPGVQRLTDEVNKTVTVGKERASSLASEKVEQASSTLAEKASQAKEKVSSARSSSSTKGQNVDRTVGKNVDDPLNDTNPVSTTVTGPKTDTLP